MEKYRGRLTIIHRNEPVRRAVEGYFEGRGFNVFTCPTPADALGEMLQTCYGDVDLLVMDCDTACERGMDLLRRLSAHRPDFPILLWIVPENPELALRAFDDLFPFPQQRPGLRTQRLSDQEEQAEDEDDVDTESEYVR